MVFMDPTTKKKVTVADTGVIRIVLIDDHVMVLDSLVSRLEQESDLAVVGVATDAREGIKLVIKHDPNIVLMDIDMPGLDCFDAVRKMRDRKAKAHIVFLSAFTNDRYIEQALDVEARGYLTKRESTDVIVQAIREVAGGGVHFSPEVQDRIVVDGKKVSLGAKVGRSSRVSLLTNRELEVIRYIARGLSKKQMALTMDLSAKTIENYSNNIMAKLGIHNRVDLARFAIREGIAEV